MKIILKDNKIDYNNIKFKKNKIIYDLKYINLLGIPIKIYNFNYTINNNNNILKVKLLNQDNITLFKNIDNYFSQNYKNYYNTINNDNVIFIKINDNTKEITDSICINLNSLKIKDFMFYLNIYYYE
jgi:hypothetical protein